MWVGMTIAGIVYLATLKKKLEVYCVRFGCEADSVMNSYGLILPLSLGLGIIFFLFYIFFLRIIYKWLAAMEYVHNLHTDRQNIMTRFIHTVGPNFPKFKKLLVQAIVYLHKFIAKCCSCETCGDVTVQSYDIDFGNTIPVLIIMTCCLGVGIFCIVVAVWPEKFALGFQVFCFIWEIVVQWITVIFNNVSTQ